MKPQSLAGIKSKRVRDTVRLACQILEGQVVDEPAHHKPSRTGMLLRRFQRGPLPENWGQLEFPRPDPGSCEECPAASVLHEWPKEVMDRIQAHPKLVRMAKARPGWYCFGAAFWKGSGKKKDRPKKITPKVREKCPLRE